MCVSVSLEVPAIGASEANLPDRRREYDGSVQAAVRRPVLSRASPAPAGPEDHRLFLRNSRYDPFHRNRNPGDRHMRTLAVIGLLAILAVIGKAVFFFGGYYNVGATSEDPKFV